MSSDKYIPGDHYIICERSGFKIRRSHAVKEWTGLLVDRRFVDIRNPQDFVRGRREQIAVEDASPEGADAFLEVNDVTEDSF